MAYIIERFDKDNEQREYCLFENFNKEGIATRILKCIDKMENGDCVEYSQQVGEEKIGMFFVSKKHDKIRQHIVVERNYYYPIFDRENFILSHGIEKKNQIKK